MIKNIRKAITELIETRTDEIDNYLFQQRKDIKDLTLQIVSLQDSAKEKIIDIDSFIDELEYMLAKRNSIIIEAVYKQGLFDGVNIKRFVSKENK